MAVLADSIRLQLWRGLMRYWSAQLEGVGVNKTDLRAAVDAADDWANSNAASFNTALPTAFKNNATAGQKALLLAVVALARYDAPLLRRLLGEID